jgi:hypothetical protein
VTGDGRRTRRGWKTLGLALVVSTVVAGCDNGSGSARDVHAAFVDKVDHVCARAVAAHAGHVFPVANFDPARPDPDQLQAVADYFARYGGLPRTDAALHALTPPPGDVAAWRRLLALADRMTANAQRQIAAARARDVSGFTNTVATTSELVARINEAGARFGFEPDSACGQVFG